METREFEIRLPNVKTVVCHYERFLSPNELYQKYSSPEMALCDEKARLMRHDDFFDTERNPKPQKPSWAGFTSTSTLWKKFIEGVTNDEVTKDAMKYANTAKVSREDKLKDIRRNVYGGAVIVPAVLSGDPRNMWCVKRKKVRSRVIHLAVDVALTWDFSSDRYVTAGKALVRTIAKLERAGYRVGVEVMISVYDHMNTDDRGRHVIAMSYPAKRPNEVMNFRKIIYPLTDTSFFRGVGFGWIVRNPNMGPNGALGQTAGAAFGYSDRNQEDGLEKMYGGMFPKETVVIRFRDVASKRDMGEMERFLEAQMLDVEE